MLDKVKQYIEDNDLITTDKPIIVALSGGRDSVALLSILLELGYETIALHCNFHLRGEESNRDESFVRLLCKQKNIPLIIRHFDTIHYSDENGISIEMAARELRYDWFEKIRTRLRLQAIAVAHHQDDQAETLLLNIVRGTGLRGLCGMRCKNGYVIRPLLCLNRKDIEQYVNDNNLQFVDDSTNNETLYKRNKIRHDILPQLQTLNPNLIDTLNKEAETFQHVNSLYEYLIENERKRTCKTDADVLEINIELLKQFPLAQELLYEFIRDYGFNNEQCGLIYNSLDSQSGKRFLSDEYELIKDRTALLICKIRTNEIQPTIQISKRPRNDEEKFPPTKSHTAFFDIKLLDQPLSLRHWQNGDSFYPLGMKESRKLSDFFSDQKISLKRKRELWLLMSGDQIAWIIGERIDNRFKVRKKSTEIVEVSIN